MMKAILHHKGSDYLDEMLENPTPSDATTFLDFLLKHAKGDFRKISGYPGIFRPARVMINDLKTGKVCEAGKLNLSVIEKCLRADRAKRGIPGLHNVMGNLKK